MRLISTGLLLPVGFTTSLQLRETPVFLKTLIAPESDSTLPRISGTVAVPVDQVEAGDRYVKYVLQPRQRLNVSKFIMARFVGLLPILWLGLLINVPSWMNDNMSRQPAKTQVHILPPPLHTQYCISIQCSTSYILHSDTFPLGLSRAIHHWQSSSTLPKQDKKYLWISYGCSYILILTILTTFVSFLQ